MAIIYGLKINLSIAIVAMVNQVTVAAPKWLYSITFNQGISSTTKTGLTLINQAYLTQLGPTSEAL
jgi:hypothetical protein